MQIRNFGHAAAIAGLTAALSLVAVSNSSAAPRWGAGAAIGAGVAGFALGAAAAGATAPYYGYGYDGYYDYAPGPYYGYEAPAYDPDPAYYPWRGRRDCRFSIGGC
jgi:hypothetical protein